MRQTIRSIILILILLSVALTLSHGSAVAGQATIPSRTPTPPPTDVISTVPMRKRFQSKIASLQYPHVIEYDEHLLIAYPGSHVDVVTPGPDAEERYTRCVDRIQEIQALGYTSLRATYGTSAMPRLVWPGSVAG